MTIKSVLILQHEFAQPLEKSGYLLNWLVKQWQEAGIEVHAVAGVSNRIEADVLFVHVDATKLSEEYLDFISAYPLVINGGVTDISKDRYSTILLNRTDNYGGPVIVKTKANYGGRNDLYLDRMAGGDSIEPDSVQRPWRKVETLDPYDYPIFNSLDEVPPGVWKNPRLIAEKFVWERNEQGHFLVRNWFFLGDQGFTRAVSSPYHIVKFAAAGKEIPGRECEFQCLDEPLHPRMQEMRESMSFDFGRFDYVMVNGEPYVFDMNTTPIMFEEGVKKNSREILEELPRGLFSFG